MDAPTLYSNDVAQDHGFPLFQLLYRCELGNIKSPLSKEGNLLSTSQYSHISKTLLYILVCVIIRPQPSVCKVCTEVNAWL